MLTIPQTRPLWTQDAVREVLVSVISEIQELGGNEVPVFTDELILLMEVAQFDSLTAVDALTSLSDKFGVEMPDDLFHHPTTFQPLALAQVVDRICAVLVVGVPGAAPQQAAS